jgi:hypothetical protein
MVLGRMGAMVGVLAIVAIAVRLNMGHLQRILGHFLGCNNRQEGLRITGADGKRQQSNVQCSIHAQFQQNPMVYPLARLDNGNRDAWS